MISLCSTSYIIENEEGKQKFSCKGVSKKALTNAMEKFEETLTTKNVMSSKNIGFRINISVIHTYSQEKIGFNYFYCKRKVLEDGVTTEPLDITVSPWEEKIVVVDGIHNPLSNLYQCKLTYDGFCFCSSKHTRDAKNMN